PGHLLSFSGNRIRLLEYWDVDFIKASTQLYSPEESVEIIRERLNESVSKRLMSDVPLGAFLSGGIDSSAIVGLMGQLLDRPVKTFSIRFTGDDKSYDWFDDASFACDVARVFGTEHTEKTVTGKDVADQLLRAVWAMDQPSGDAIQYYIVSGCAAQDVTVALSGTGGDEVFAGYEWFKEIRRIEQIHRNLGYLSPSIAAWMESKLNRMNRSYELHPIRKKLRTLLAGRKNFATRYSLNRRLYFGEDYFYLFSPDMISKTVDYPYMLDPRLMLYSNRCADLDAVNRMSYMQLKTDMVNLLVRDQDAVSMAHGLEVRLPMIDYKLVEAAARVPASMKLNGSTEKFVLREAVKDLLPAKITRRRKKGFMFPMADWMRNELKPVVQSCLSRDSIKKRGIFSPDTVEALTKDFYNGKQPFFKIWNLALFELWCRVVLDRPDGWSEPPGELEDYLT
ncbi:asparagine synthase C-terminal domain-containing protein, partial [bacterium]|nr:asparagine synthase C-terminal domain-containing protein [bacterium]